ncbi:MAG: cytochrome c [Bacteroidota bacterium]
MNHFIQIIGVLGLCLLSISYTFIIRGAIESKPLDKSLKAVPISPLELALEGHGLFEEKCRTCHLVGHPHSLIESYAMKYDTEEEIEWLKLWIRTGDSLRLSGDNRAIQLFESFNQLGMPAFPELSDRQLKAIFTYLDFRQDSPHISFPK